MVERQCEDSVGKDDVVILVDTEPGEEECDTTSTYIEGPDDTGGGGFCGDNLQLVEMELGF